MKRKLTELRTGVTHQDCANSNCKSEEPTSTSFIVDGKQYCSKECVLACEEVYDDTELWN